MAVSLIVGILFLLIAVAGLGLRFIFKGESVRGTCASQTPLLNQSGESCGICGRKPGEECGDPEKEKIAKAS
jgi:hypothetical protein